MSDPCLEQRLRRSDYGILVLVGLVLFGFSLVNGRVLTGHESVLPENAREMLADHDWVIPKCGGTPWLERPPVPDWIMVGIGAVFGRCDRGWIVRLGPVLMATVTVCLAAWVAAVWYGRTIGLLSGLILATMWLFFSFASDPEGDIFLCAIVTAAIALFVKLEFVGSENAAGEGRRFFGGRPWLVLAFFVALGMTNLAKGLVFGTAMVCIPVAGFLLWNADVWTMRRYVWLWGWLVCAAIGLAWPVAAYLRYPGSVDLWFFTYTSRFGQSPFHGPPWYYFMQLPVVTLPWSLAAVLGLWLTGRRAFGARHSSERFLWSWALLTPAILSIPDGKHHHYLLHCVAPWAVLSAQGAVRLWQSIPRWPAWLRHPALSLLTLGLPGDLIVAAVASHIPGPSWIVPALLVGWPVFAFGLCWVIAQRNGRLVVGGVFTLLTVVYCLGYAYQTRYCNSYREDRAFLQEVREVVPPGKPLFISFDRLYPLETFHLLFYSDARARLLHNPTFLLDERIRDREVYVVARYREMAELTAYGVAEVMFQSKHTRAEVCLGERRTLFRLRFKDGLERKPADVIISPKQAAHVEEGPFLQ